MVMEFNNLCICNQLWGNVGFVYEQAWHDKCAQGTYMKVGNEVPVSVPSGCGGRT